MCNVRCQLQRSGVLREQCHTVIFDRNNCYILLSERDQLAIAKILVYKLITHNDIDIVSVAGCIIDLNFVVDSSQSINDTTWAKAMEFISGIVQRLTIGPNDVRVSFVLFNTTANVLWELSRYQDKASLLNAIQSVQKQSGRSNLNQALYLTWSQVFRQARQNADKITIILTDGNDNQPSLGTQLTIDNANSCKQNGIRLIVVGVQSVNEPRLTLIASSPSDYHKLDQTDVLNTVVNKLLIEDNCKYGP